MSPEAALQLQIKRYREMTPEQRVSIALGVHDLACEMARLGIRHQNPGASPDQVEELLRYRIRLAHRLAA
jgi:hypothetical protein